MFLYVCIIPPGHIKSKLVYCCVNVLLILDLSRVKEKQFIAGTKQKRQSVFSGLSAMFDWETTHLTCLFFKYVCIIAQPVSLLERTAQLSSFQARSSIPQITTFFSFVRFSSSHGFPFDCFYCLSLRILFRYINQSTESTSGPIVSECRLKKWSWTGT